jgi:hypothetical protein
MASIIMTTEALHPKDVGDRSEAAALFALTRNGYSVFLPFGENHRYDLIAERNGSFFRIQVKTGRLGEGRIAFRCYSSYAHHRKKKDVRRSYLGEIDFLAVYCPETAKVYLIPEQDLVRTEGHLRLTPPANSQRRGIRWAASYELP